MRFQRMRFGFSLLILCMLLPLACFALSLNEAKSKGILGEQPNGYLGVVVSSSEANQLAQDINAQRRDLYKSIAEKNGTALTDVEALAGKKAIDNTPPGGYVKAANGGWVKK